MVLCESLGELAQSVVAKLSDPLALSKEETFRELLLDAGQVRKEFDFREQALIYATAEKIKGEKLSKKSALEESLEPVQEAINFLDEVMATLSGHGEELEVEVEIDLEDQE